MPVFAYTDTDRELMIGQKHLKEAQILKDLVI
jgi:hypothetical protein